MDTRLKEQLGIELLKEAPGGCQNLVEFSLVRGGSLEVESILSAGSWLETGASPVTVIMLGK